MRLSNPRSVDRRRRKTREAILSAFVRLFFEKGYDAVSIGAVASAADVGRSTLYTHFARKEDMLRVSMEELLVGLAGVVNPAREDGLPRLMVHFWENRRHRAIFSLGACRNVLAAALAEKIERELADPALFERPPRWRVPIALAARLIADHQLNLLDRWLNTHTGVDAAMITEAMRHSVRSLCSGLALRDTEGEVSALRRGKDVRDHLAV